MRGLIPMKFTANIKISLPIITALMMLILAACSPKGESDNKQGLALYNKGQYNSAVTSFEAAIAANKRVPEYYVNLGMTYIELENYTGALTQFDLALELDADNRLAKRGRGIAELALGNYNEALDAFADVLSSANGIVGTLELDILDYRAIAEAKSGDCKAAINTYTTLINADYRTTEHYFLRGQVYLLDGNLDCAVSDFNETLKNNTDCTAYLNIYGILAAAGYTDEARAFLSQALTDGVKGDDFSFALIYYYMEDYTNALIKFTSAKEGGNYQALLYISRIYRLQGNTLQAKNALLEYLTHDNSNAEVYNRLGLISISENDYASALSYFQTGILTNDASLMQELKWNEIVCYEYLGDFKTACSKAGEYVTLYPDDAAALREYEFLKTR